MFKDEYKEAMEIHTPTQEQIYKVKAAMKDRTATKSRAFRRAPVFAAIAAALCLAIFGGTFFSPRGGNSFSISAYALDPQEGDSELRLEFDLVPQSSQSGSLDDGGEYLSIGLKCVGENVKSAVFSADEQTFFGEDSTFTFTQTESELQMDELFVIGIGPISDEFNAAMPDFVTLRAVVTFNDGVTQEETLTLDLAAMLK
ncbi:MAG: hypothetical protein LBN99_07440 [Oscillospiraceae bacterium]|jgi:hypothetical protein|nr:hypothetical protein [Oscillospiraceae bacterium]